MKYIQMTKTYDVQYIELLSTVNPVCDMIFNETLLEISGPINGYGYINLYIQHVYIQKILKDVNEYNIKIEKVEEITLNVSEEITKVDILNNTNKIPLVTKIENGQVKFKKSRGAEYDIVFAPSRIRTDYYGNKEYKYKYRGVYEDGKELEQKMLYSPSFEEETYSYYRTIKQGENKLEYTFEANGQFESNIFWEDDKHAKLQFNLRESWKFYNILLPSGYYEDYFYIHEDWESEYIIFIEKLDKDFGVSRKYEQDPQWLIVNEEDIKDTKFEVPEYAKEYLKLDLENNEYIPEYVYANLFLNNFNMFDKLDYETYIKSNEKIYNIYIKDKNMLYCLVPIDKPNNELSIELEYKGNKFEEDRIFNFSTKSIYLYNYSNGCNGGVFGQYYIRNTLTDKQITCESNNKTRIVINKSVENKEENKAYYVGLFENENESNTDKVYSIDIVNGKGSTKIEFDEYDESRMYFVYEVDENGNKIENENLIYNKNKVLENVNKNKEYNILSDESIISSVYSTLANEGYRNYYGFETFTEDIGKGKGEEYYIDNSLVTTKVYEDIVTISENNEKPHLVRYETEKDGKLEGDTEEIIIEGNKPINVPKVIASEGYEFDKWIVIKDGKEIEVNPSEYVVYEDTIFIAKYKKIEKEIDVEEKIDTSDINILKYVGIAMISVLVIAIVVIIIIVNKKRKTT